MKFKKILSIILVLSLSLSILAGCTTGGKSSELRTVSMFGGTDPSAVDYKAILDGLKDQINLKIKDESSTTNEEWKAKILADFASGNEPDVIFYFTGSEVEDLLKENKFVSIEEIREEFPNYAQNITKNAMSFMEETDGKTYAIPVRGFFEGLYINEDLFEKHNAPLPTDWESFIKAIEIFAKTDITPIAASFADVPHYLIENLIYSAGGSSDHGVSPKTIQEVPDSWKKGLEMFKTLRDMGAFSKDVAATQDPITGNSFKEGKSAMVVDGSWFAGGVPNQKTTKLYPFPAMNGSIKSPTGIIGGFSTGFYITRKAWDNADKREAAVQFVTAMTSNEAIAKFAKVAGAPAADIKLDSDTSILIQQGVELSNKASEIVMPMDSRLSKEAWNSLVSSISGVSDGSKKIDDVLSELVSKNK